jgi:hypothetical protein
LVTAVTLVLLVVLGGLLLYRFEAGVDPRSSETIDFVQLSMTAPEASEPLRVVWVLEPGQPVEAAPQSPYEILEEAHGESIVRNTSNNRFGLAHPFRTITQQSATNSGVSGTYREDGGMLLFMLDSDATKEVFSAKALWAQRFGTRNIGPLPPPSLVFRKRGECNRGMFDFALGPDAQVWAFAADAHDRTRLVLGIGSLALSRWQPNGYVIESDVHGNSPQICIIRSPNGTIHLFWIEQFDNVEELFHVQFPANNAPAVREVLARAELLSYKVIASPTSDVVVLCKAYNFSYGGLLDSRMRIGGHVTLNAKVLRSHRWSSWDDLTSAYVRAAKAIDAPHLVDLNITDIELRQVENNRMTLLFSTGMSMQLGHELTEEEKGGNQSGGNQTGRASFLQNSP